MKLIVYHHNGQLAEFPLDTVTGVTLEPDEPGGPVHEYTGKANRILANVLKGTSEGDVTFAADHPHTKARKAA